ncbi:beta-aspartyl-peptidase [Rubricoccus marinus]|uniref:Isoaspartyl dipeptidase n=1 Tax=Rubricoccus marinus TaxID=716817 RepID=A0A259TWN4_9BACT|nr:beta-aspartyl-peptidase [Rubricoccus marinus]OZC02037.1 beta-aspartyl-peptidase [Rubricoccus marinus]
MPALTLLLNAEVFAPQPLGRRCVLVGGGQILAISERPPTLAGVEVETVDLDGARLVPGLIDLHVHVTGGGGEAGPETAAPAPSLSHYTRAGVTSVVGLLGTDDTTRTTAGLLRQVRALRREGLGAWAWTGGYHLPPTTLTGSVRGDIAHLSEVIGFGELALSDHRSSQPTVHEVARVAADCHVGGLMTGKAGVLHCHMGDGARGLGLLRDILDTTEIPPRTLHPTHVNRKRALWEESLVFAERGSTIDVTAFPPEFAETDEVGAAEAVRAYVAGGLPLAQLTVSSDGGGCLPHFDAQGEMTRMDFATSGALADLLADLLDGGMAPEDALAPLTSNPADLLRLHAKGRIAPGADADLVVLGDDHRPRDVMARGRWHVRGGEPVVRGTFEA